MIREKKLTIDRKDFEKHDHPFRNILVVLRRWLDQEDEERSVRKSRGGRAICRCKGMNDRIGVNGGNLDVWTRGKQMLVDLRGYACAKITARERPGNPLERNVMAALILRSH